MIKNRKIIYILLILFSPIITVIAKETPQSGEIDWLNGQIIAKGFNSIIVNDSGKPFDLETGSILSISRARAIAYEKSKERAIINATELLKNMQIDQENRLNDLMLQDPIVKQLISLIIKKNATYKETPIDYLNTQCILKIKNGALIKATNYQFPEDNFPKMDQRDISTLYTSLIIDTRGLEISPMLLPLIFNEDGLEIYSKNKISKKEAIKNQAVSYVYDENSALKHKKAGTSPYYCTALKNINGCPVISNEDFKRVFSDDRNIAYLKKCRVIFIIDRRIK